MKPAQFDYKAPTSVEEAVGLLASLDDAKPIAGGQSLMPMLNMRIAQPLSLVDINGLRELDYIRHEDDAVAVGAMTRQRDLELDPQVRAELPVLPEVMRHIGHVTIRNRGTVGGSISHADPAAELPLLAVALDADLVAQGPGGRRTVAARDFFHTYLTTDLREDELLVEVRFPVARGFRYGFEELTRRGGDFAIVSVLALVELDGDTCAAARIAVGGASSAPMRIEAAESALAGESISAVVIDRAAEAVVAAVDPTADVHAPAAYRRQVSGELTKRALSSAFEGVRQAT